MNMLELFISNTKSNFPYELIVFMIQNAANTTLLCPSSISVSACVTDQSAYICGSWAVFFDMMVLD
jgi:hypothetical protein